MENIVWHKSEVSRVGRETMNGHRGALLWLTGLPGSGKSSVAHALEARLFHLGCRTFVLDGDNVRHGLCSDLGFSAADREENIRRAGEIGRLFVEAGTLTIAAFVSPFRVDRARVRALMGADFIEVYCRCAPSLCEARDTKGFYRRARSGELPEFTGISSPYEEPEAPELVLDTGVYPVQECVETLLSLLRERGIINDPVRVGNVAAL